MRGVGLVGARNAYNGRRTLESLDNERACAWNDRDGGLTVLDRQLHGYTKTFPLLGGLGDVFADFLG